MINFDKNYFVEQEFSEKELGKYYESAKRDLRIAKKNKEPEVRFHFVYMALIKIGIYHISKNGYRIKSRPGHHQAIIEYLSKILSNEDIKIIGDKMRKDRNLDLYSAGMGNTADEISMYVAFVDKIFKY